MTTDRKTELEKASKPSDEPLPKGTHTSKADFDRNRDGLYGGRPEVRGAETPPAK